MSKGTNQLVILREMAVQHLKAGKYQKAAIYFKDILERFEKIIAQIQDQAEMQRVIRQLKISSHKNLSLCYLKLKKYQQCVSECQKVLDIEPNNVKILYRMGKVLIQKRELDSAQNYLKRAFHIDPHQKEVMKALEEIQSLRNSKQTATQTSLTIKLQDLFVYLLSIVFWIPLFIYRKGRDLTAKLPSQTKRQ